MQFSSEEFERQAWESYVEAVVGTRPACWSAVVLTAGSERQAKAYRAEIDRRLAESKIPRQVSYLVVPDQAAGRLGSGGATINALRGLAAAHPETARPEWWAANRVLLIHSGGESRRLPQYSQSGKVFSCLPMRTPWGEHSTVFDHLLAASTTWMERMRSGLLLSSGDVVLKLDSRAFDWEQPGICGVAVLQPALVGTQHGVYVLDEKGNTYTVLQKPSLEELRAAGALVNGQVPVDSGLLYLSGDVSCQLMTLATKTAAIPFVDLYQEIAWAVGRRRTDEPGDGEMTRAFRNVLRGTGLRCVLVEGEFIHVGSTSSHRNLLSGYGGAGGVDGGQRRLGRETPEDLQISGTLVDSTLAPGSHLAHGALAIECHVTQAVVARPGAVLHGLWDWATPLDVPENLVVHQVPILREDGSRGEVVRVFGADDDPKVTPPTWMNRPMDEVLRALSLKGDDVWPGVPASQQTLWNAKLFPVGTVEMVGRSARWMMGEETFGPEDWIKAERLSLEESAALADHGTLLERRLHRSQALWVKAAVELAQLGCDSRPMLRHSPGLAALHETGRTLTRLADEEAGARPTAAASLYFRSYQFLRQAGLGSAASEASERAFQCVQDAVASGIHRSGFSLREARWRRDRVAVSAPVRIDLGGGWSDTPPFCLDCGGAVLNVALNLNGAPPIQVVINRIEAPLIRCVDTLTGESKEFRSSAELLRRPSPAEPFALTQAVLQAAGMFGERQEIGQALRERGGGISIHASVNLPVGSGLGTSSILSAALCRALAEMAGLQMTEQMILDWVMAAEQQMTTGGGWQDQAGALFPGAKLLVTMAGVSQPVRVEPVRWSANQQAEFEGQFLVYYTGIRRLAKDLLRQVVGKYLARDTRTIEILHTIKTLAIEMSHAMGAGDWDTLGDLMRRHWLVNQELDPNTTNARISALLDAVASEISGAKLAGAGGGGFMLMLARSPEAARRIRARLSASSGSGGGGFFEYEIARHGLVASYE